MIEYIEGKLISIHPNAIVVQSNGIGYRIITANPYQWQSSLMTKILVYSELVVREDSLTLYGFFSQEDKQLFLTLNKVSGIGPKSALSIMAADDNEGLIKAIEEGNSQYLIKFPGVGKKTAQQMILDLKGELSIIATNKDKVAHFDKNHLIHEEVIEALSGLGYSQREINRVRKEINQETFNSTQEGLSFAFKLLLNK